MNYGQVMSAKLKNDSQPQLEKSPYELKILLNACGQKVSFFLMEYSFFHYYIFQNI
jgi:hypothetical protein